MFESRRKNFMKKMGDGVAIIRTGDEIIRNNDNHYKYRVLSDFYYLTGFDEPNSVAVFLPNHPEHKFIMFVRPKDPERETWDGKRADIEGAIKDFGADIAYSIDDIDEKLPDLIKSNNKLYYTFGLFPNFDQKIINILGDLRRKVRKGISYPRNITEVGQALHSLRLIKSSEEVELMRKSNFIAQEAHIQAMKSTKPGMYEFEVEALIENEFKKNGAYYNAYPSIVGGGLNATILHYNDNNSKLNDGDLLLIDAGAEYKYYASDITRTFPVNGKFTEAQKLVYEVVLEAQIAAIKISKPGTKFWDLHKKTVEVLTEGMVDIGLLKGNVSDLIETEEYKKFYMHNTGHWIGIDVHDVGSYYDDNRESVVLESGMVTTIEPGLYIQEGTKGVDPKFIGIGIRIEDDILITESGNENLSDRVPKTVSDIEGLMKG